MCVIRERVMNEGHHIMNFKFKSHNRCITLKIPEGTNLNWIHVERYFRFSSKICCDLLYVYDSDTGKDYTDAPYMPPDVSYVVHRKAAETNRKRRCGRPCSWVSRNQKHLLDSDIAGRLQEANDFMKTIAESSAKQWKNELRLADREYLNNTPKVAYGIPRDRLVKCKKTDANSLKDTTIARTYVSLSCEDAFSTDQVVIPELIDYCKSTPLQLESS